MRQKILKVIKIRKKGLIKDLRYVFLLLLITTVLLATPNTLQIKSESGQFESIRDSDWFWTDIEVLSKESNQNVEFPEAITDSIGNLHILWVDQTNYLGSGTDRDIFYKRWEANSNTWTVTEVVSESTLESFSPDIAVDSLDNVHFVWDENNLVVLHKQWNAATQSWSSITTISTESSASSTNPSIGVDSSDNIHVVWGDNTDYLGSGGEYDIFYKIWNETKQSWSTTQVVSTESTASSFVPKIAVDSIGNVHVTWDDSTDYLGADTDRDIFYKYLDASTKIWQPAEVLSNESIVLSLNPDLAVDSLDNVYIVWEDSTGFDGAEGDSDIFYIIRDKESASWTIPEVISDVGGSASWFPSIDIDLENNIYIAWEDASVYDGADTDLDIFYRMFSSHKETWLKTEVISTDSTTSSRFVSLAVGKYGSVNIVWSDYTNLSYYGNDPDIFFKRFIGPPTEPTLAPIVPGQIGTDILQLKWNDAEGVRQYYIYRDTSYIWSVDHLDPIFSVSTNTILDTLPDTGIYYYVVVADNVQFNSSLSNCVFVEYTVAHVREFVISISIVTIIAMLVITMRIRRKRYKE